MKRLQGGREGRKESNKKFIQITKHESHNMCTILVFGLLTMGKRLIFIRSDYGVYSLQLSATEVSAMLKCPDYGAQG